MLPIKLINFWYSEGAIFWIRVLKNTLLFLEEDLAVGLMIRLLFVPLFHDTSIFGRILSFLFRITRIFFGVITFILAASLIIALAFVWLASPPLLLLPLFVENLTNLTLLPILVIFLGLALFLNELINKPLKKIWQIKKPADFWYCTKLTEKDITWGNLSQNIEVKNLLNSLELSDDVFREQNIAFSQELISEILQLAKLAQAHYITPAYFWLAMLKQVPNVDRELLRLNLRVDDFVGALIFEEFKRNEWRRVYIWQEEFAIRHLAGTNRGWLGAPTPALDAVSMDLTKEAARLGYPEFIGREAIIHEVITIVSQNKDRNVLLVGSPGAGRTTLVNSLATWIISGDAPEALATKRLVSIDITRLLADVTTEGELAQKVKAAFEEVQVIQDIIIFIDEIQNMGMGEAGGQFNLYSLMLPYLESDQFQFIATTDPGSYAKIIERNGSFARIFHKVELPPASAEDTIKIVEKRSINLMRQQNIGITYLAIKELARLSSKLIHDRVLPDAALVVLDECEVGTGLITTKVVKAVMEKRISVPIAEVDEGQKGMLLNLENIIHQWMIDQEEAVHAVSDALRRSAASLREQSRPIGSFLFVGPTGVGKTELAKTLSEVYFRDEALEKTSDSVETKGAFIRFDMSEYQNSESVNRLLGSENNPGELTEAIKRKPYALLLLDEFEKANSQILTLFLQVLDEGRLTSYTGEHVDFTNTIIIATSNAASLQIAQGLQAGQNLKEVEKNVRAELLKIYKPELINRFDEVVIFKPLSPQDLAKIVTIKLNGLAKMLKEQGYLIEFSPELIAELGKRGYDPVLGARPLRRLIQDSLESKLSRLILENKLIKGEVFRAGLELLN